MPQEVWDEVEGGGAEDAAPSGCGGDTVLSGVEEALKNWMVPGKWRSPAQAGFIGRS